MAARPSSSPPRSPTIRPRRDCWARRNARPFPGQSGWWHLGDLFARAGSRRLPGRFAAVPPAPDDEEPLAAAGSRLAVLGCWPSHSMSAGRTGPGSPVSPGGLAFGPRRVSNGLGRHVSGGCLERRQRLGSGANDHAGPVWLSVEADRYGALERYGDAAAPWPPSLPARGPTPCGAVGIRSGWGSARRFALAHAAIAAEHFRPLGLDEIQLDHGWQRGYLRRWFPNERFPHGLKWLSEQLHSHYE